MASLKKQHLEKTDWISWSAYHSSMQEAVIPPPAINALLPLFLDSARSVAMIKHSMEIVRAAVQHLNPVKSLFLLWINHCMHLPSKFSQWTWLTSLGEDHFVLMLGGLHIEMDILKVCSPKNSKYNKHCGSKKGCTRQCKCVKAALKCTALCFCQGECQ